MKRAYPLLLLLAALLLLTGCESGGKLRVINRSSYPVFVRVADSAELKIAGGAEHTFSVSTAKQHIFNPGVEKVVTVWAKGETFQLEEEEQGILRYVDSTRVVIHAGETLPAYCTPNRASFKVVNNSSKAIQHAILYKRKNGGNIYVADLGWISSGEAKFIPVDYATSSNNFSYFAEITPENGSPQNFGDETNILDKDEQFLITLTDPE